MIHALHDMKAMSSFGVHFLQRPSHPECANFLACSTQKFVILMGTWGIKVTRQT